MTIRSTRWGFAIATIAIFLVSFVAPASAQSHELMLSTRFPGITVKPGAEVSLWLNVANSGTSGIVTLDVVEYPEGWEEPTLRGGGFTVNQVYVPSGEDVSVELELTVPEGTSEGTYEVIVTAEKGGTRSTLPLQLEVAPTAASRASLSTEFPSIKAQAGTSYTFRVDLRNDSDVKQMFALSANPPQGWQVTFKPAYESKVIGTIPVDANASQGIDVEVEVPEQIDAGVYKVPIVARSGSAEARLELELDVVGEFDLLLTTPTGRLSAEAVAGRDNEITLKVENTGTAPLENIRFSASEPVDWKVTFEPETLETLEPGESREVTAKVKPYTRAIAGDYLLTIYARAEGTSASDRAEFRVAVQTPTLWGLTGVAALLAVGGGLWWVFRTYGRR